MKLLNEALDESFIICEGLMRRGERRESIRVNILKIVNLNRGVYGDCDWD